MPCLFSSTNMALDATSVKQSNTSRLSPFFCAAPHGVFYRRPLSRAAAAAATAAQHPLHPGGRPGIQRRPLAQPKDHCPAPGSWHTRSDHLHSKCNFPTLFQASLASSGLILESAYVQPVCTPTRSALLTGYHPVHLGRQVSFLWPLEPKGLYTNFTLLPEHLNRLGYRSHAVRK